ncbi:ribonuclease P protein component [Deinococcus pimensis]|uniref:ribonuclease P protein component n=1 Tax=Deinococcus pimensis TaxID=309888 RepID=UPI0004B9CBF7|nr:ribonuclease P protein component [Deinococcus pimensis]
MTDPNAPARQSAPAEATRKPRRRSAGLTSLRGDAEFRQVRKGRAVRTPYFTLRAVHYRPKHGTPWKPMTVVGIVVPKKVLRSAVDRNRARRRLKEAMRRVDLPPCRAVLMPTPEVLTVDFEVLTDALRRAFDRAAP